MKTKDMVAIRARKYERKYGRFVPKGATCYLCHRAAPDETGEVKRLSDGRHVCWRHPQFKTAADCKLTERRSAVVAG